MPRRTDVDDEWDEDDDETDTVPCPYCHRPVSEDTPRCPYCEQYISGEDAPPAPKPWWILVGAVLGLIAAYWWVFGR